MQARFFRSDAMAERLGEAEDLVIESEWFQLTYNALRTAPDGETVAAYDGFADAWRAPSISENCFSDVVLSP